MSDVPHRALVRKERLELSRLSAPAPKAGASTNSATFAAGFAKQISIAQTAGRYHEAPGSPRGPSTGQAFGLGIRIGETRVYRSLRELSCRLAARSGRAAPRSRCDL